MTYCPPQVQLPPTLIEWATLKTSVAIWQGWLNSHKQQRKRSKCRRNAPVTLSHLGPWQRVSSVHMRVIRAGKNRVCWRFESVRWYYSEEIGKTFADKIFITADRSMIMAEVNVPWEELQSHMCIFSMCVPTHHLLLFCLHWYAIICHRDDTISGLSSIRNGSSCTFNHSFVFFEVSYCPREIRENTGRGQSHWK